jgi:hypothetical protein
MRLLNALSAVAIVGASILALPISPVSAFALYGPSFDKQAANTQAEQVFYRGGGFRRGGLHRGGYGLHGGVGYRGYGGGLHRYGYGGAALVGGMAVGAAVAGRRCWINGYGNQVCG